MTVAFRSLTSTTYASRTNTTLTAPAGLANGDILLAAIITGANNPGVASTPPAGFTALPGSPTTVFDAGGFYGKLAVYKKVAASESGSYTFTHATASSQGVLLAVSGADGTSPVDVSSSNFSGTGATGGGNTTTATGVTTTNPADLLVYLAHDWTGSGALSPPAGFTENFDSLLYVGTKLLTAAGATGSVTQTNGNPNNPGNPWAAYLIAIKPPAGGSTGRTKVWDGSAWAIKPAKVWTGAAWVTKPAKIWNGSAWV